MATESPIRIFQTRGKWAFHDQTSNISADERALLLSGQGHKYDRGPGMIPNRSGSAPPTMEGSLASIDNLMSNSFTSGYEHSVSSGAHNQSRLTPFSGSSDNFLQLYRSSLSTHKEESEDDQTPKKVSNEFINMDSVVWYGQESSFVGDAKNFAESIKDEFTCMSSPTHDNPASVCDGQDDGSHNHEHSINILTSVSSNTHVDNSSDKQIADPTNISPDSETNTLTSEDQAITYLQSGIKALNLTETPKFDKNDTHMHQPVTTLQYQSSVPQIVSHVIPNQALFGGKFPSTEAQPVLHSSGFTPQLYATTTASYVHSANPYYTGVQQHGVVYPTQYGIGGYPYNPGVVPSYLGGYPNHNPVPLGFDGSSTAVTDVITQGVDMMQHMNSFYQQVGFPPPVVDPRMQFYRDFYNGLGQVDPLASRGGVMETQVSGSDNQTGSVMTHQRGVFTGIDYGVSSTNTGFFPHVMNSGLASPVLPGSPLGAGVRSVGSPHSGRSGSPYGRGYGHRVFENFNHQKQFSYLEELKSGKGRRFELSDIVGHVVDFSVDQHGSRFIQQKLENCSIEEKQSVFQEVIPHASKLMSDVFGNYVIQKFFEYGTSDQRRDLANALRGQMLQLSLQMYGCRVIQKALDVIEVEQKTDLVHELNGHILRCVRDQNGNHVIQKCIECIPSERIGFIISSFRGQVATLSMHPYGCRVIQRILERCTTELETQFIVDEILESVCTLAQDQYGNYVTQHVLEKGKPHEKLQIIKNLSGKVVEMSQHKFASNVIEKCLDHGDETGRELLIGEVIGSNVVNDNLLVMMKDQYANYVVQKILEKCTDTQRDLLIGRIAVHLNGLKKYTYGKHIVTRFEKLFGEIQAPES